MTVAVRKSDQVAELVRGRIASGDLRAGMLAPSGEELARELGFAVLTCRAGLRALFAAGELTRLSRSGRYHVPGGGPSDGERELSLALAVRRRAAGLRQDELADAIGMSITAVGHAETGRLWQGRRFWEMADKALEACGALLAQYDARLTPSQPCAADGRPAEPTAAAAGVAEPAGIVITLPGDPVPVTVVWADGSTATVLPRGR